MKKGEFLKTVETSLVNMGTAPYDDEETMRRASEATKKTFENTDALKNAKGLLKANKKKSSQ